MKLVGWNIRHGGGSSAIPTALASHDPDAIVLTEYRDPGSKKVLDQLRFFGWPHVSASRVTGLTNGVAIVSKVPVDPRPTPLDGAEMARWLTEVFIASEALSLIGIYAPLSNSFGTSKGLQRRFWTEIRDLMVRRAGERVILVGDFNVGTPGLDGPRALPCCDLFESLPSLGWVDAWRALNPGGTDFSYIDMTRPARTQWRIDHAFVSPALATAVQSCRYSHIEREQGLSDHSMLILDIQDSAASV